MGTYHMAESRESRGGLTMFWKGSFNVEIIQISDRIIHCLIRNEGALDKWYLIGVYGFTRHSKKVPSLESVILNS